MLFTSPFPLDAGRTIDRGLIPAAATRYSSEGWNRRSQTPVNGHVLTFTLSQASGV